MIIPLLANTVAGHALSVLADRVKATATTWISAVPGASIEGVDVASTTVDVRERTPGRVPGVSAVKTECNRSCRAASPSS